MPLSVKCIWLINLLKVKYIMLDWSFTQLGFKYVKLSKGSQQKPKGCKIIFSVEKRFYDAKVLSV